MRMRNGDGVYGNSYDSEFQGTSTTPKYNFGIQASANWKDFDFSMTWGGSAGLVFITMVRQGIQVKRLMVMQFRMR